MSPLLSVDSILSHFLPWLQSSFFILRQVVFGLPLFLFPSGAHVRAVTSSLFLSFLRMWPINFHLRLFTLLLKGSISALSNNSSVLTWSCHYLIYHPHNIVATDFWEVVTEKGEWKFEYKTVIQTVTDNITADVQRICKILLGMLTLILRLHVVLNY